jgi:glycosyltransferase involved in cell wall biosynthesis
MRLAIVSFGHADSILHYAKTMSRYYEVELIFIFALNKRTESVLNFEKENLETGFLTDEQAGRILGEPLLHFIAEEFKVRFYINYNLKIHSCKNIILSKKLASYLKNYNIVHFNGMDSTLLLINIFLKNKNKVFTLHDIKLHSGENEYGLINFPERFCKWIIKSKYHTVIQNKKDFEDVVRIYQHKKDKIHLIPFKCLYIFRRFLSDNINPVKSDILFFGRMSPYKGLQYLVDAIDLVRKTYKDVTALIAGGGDIEVISRNNNRDNNFIIINRYITNEELASFIDNTRIVVCPYTDATQSGVVMTSFAFGKPVIASTVGGFTDVIDENITGLLIPPRDVEKLADAIIYLLSDENRIEEMEKNIKDICEYGRLSWDSIANDAKNMYESVLNG